MKYRIGYIEEEALQLKKYQRDLRTHFTVIGYEITKGLALEALVQQIYESDIDLLLVDYLLVQKGVLTFNGDEVVRAYEEVKPRFPVLIFTNYEAHAFPHVDNPNNIVEKDLVRSDKKRFVQIIKKNITLYQNFVNSRKETIQTLLKKGETKGLTSAEKDQLLENQLELRSLDKWTREVPQQLLSNQKIDALTQTRKEAEAYLNSLIKKNKK